MENAPDCRPASPDRDRHLHALLQDRVLLPQLKADSVLSHLLLKEEIKEELRDMIREQTREALQQKPDA